MHGHFFTRTRLLLIALLILPWLLPLLLRSISPTLSFVFGVVAVICSFAALAFLFTPTTQEMKVSPPPVKQARPVQADVLPQVLSIPTALAEVYVMDPTDFELFSAAVVVGGLNEGYTFKMHHGGRNDRGVDFRLLDKYGRRVVGQSKRYVPPHNVGSRHVRELKGTIGNHRAFEGFLVTSSAFTAEALYAKRSSENIRTIDGETIAKLLQTRAREIAQAYDDIRARIQAEI